MSFETMNRRCSATIYDSPNEERTIWGFCVGKKGYDYKDQDYLIFYDIEADDGTFYPGIFEEDVTFMGYFKKEKKCA